MSIQANGARAVQHLLRSIQGRCKDCSIPTFASICKGGCDYVIANHYELPPDHLWASFKIDLLVSERNKERLKILLQYATHYRRDVETLLEIIDGLCSGEIDGKQLARLQGGEHECGLQDERKDQPHEAGRE